jgi:hypothetical protein
MKHNYKGTGEYVKVLERATFSQVQWAHRTYLYRSHAAC